MRALVTILSSHLCLLFALVLSQGVLDEHSLLREENEVIVCGGDIHGPVLVARSPCNHPGDVQKAIALSRTTLMQRVKQHYHESLFLDDVIVFSAQGQRPLPDKLAGGDLDGDEFYVIFDDDIVSSAKTVEPVKGVQATSCASASTPSPDEAKNTVKYWFGIGSGYPPDWAQQLKVCSDLLKQDDIVSISANAWLRVADHKGSTTYVVVVFWVDSGPSY